MNNIITETDSYKFGSHWNMYPAGTQNVFSYFECRTGAKWDKTVFFGLQYILKRHLAGVVVTQEKIEKAAALSKAHFGTDAAFNRKGWEYILNNHGGKLPVRIRAVPEGTVVGISNALITIESTDPNCEWLVNYLETILSRIWYPITVATLSYQTKKMIGEFLNSTAESSAGLDFMLHDFGYRGVSSEESACIGGAAHLVNFLGTDTMGAMELLMDFYNAPAEGIAYSVPASEHSVMTALGPEGEKNVVESLLDKYPTGILSVVADSYNIYNFVSEFVGNIFKDRILAREGVFVIRPDSVTPKHDTPESEMVWIIEELWNKIGGAINSKGYKVINPKVRVLWGDGIDILGINAILYAVKNAGFSVENIACFGMGGGLLQKVNRDTLRCAFKSCAQLRDGVWYDIKKNPLDTSKKSKAGRLKLVKDGDNYITVAENDLRENELKVVFENGELLNETTLAEVRQNVRK
jgi:nicotinamide phosphoribosyltransferase